jgi:hypothetical protein
MIVQPYTKACPPFLPPGGISATPVEFVGHVNRLATAMAAIACRASAAALATVREARALTYRSKPVCYLHLSVGIPLVC